MPPEEAIQVADEVLLAHAGTPLTDIQRMILRDSLAGKGYGDMVGYDTQHIKNEGKKLWDLLSHALEEKVSKTSFRGALEKRWKLGKLPPTPPMLSIYNPQTWVGRKTIIDKCLPKLQGQARILWITGISGIGKTALGECLASQAWESNPTFQWLYLEILEGQSPEFISVAADLLAKLGDVDLDSQERNDPKRLIERLLRKLKVSRYWLQVDSLERLLSSEKLTETEFVDRHWVTFLQQCLTEPNFASRLVLTAQALPSSLAELEERYPNCWQAITLQGLLAHQSDDQQSNEHLALFAKNGLSVDNSSASHLRRIGQIYEGHPLVLQVIAKEILAAPFNGNGLMYWDRYGNEFEQVARELQAERVSPELYNQALQKRVRRRVELSLKQLPTDALELLCRSSVYRRPVPETFWLSMLEEKTSQQRQQAYQILNERAFVEREGIHQNQFLIRQHNLVRAVAYDLLKADTHLWHQSERQAAHLWLTAYALGFETPNLEIVRGYLEAVEHYYEAGNWKAAKEILLTPLDSVSKMHILQQLAFWSLHQEGIQVCQKILKKFTFGTDIICLVGMLGNYYLHLDNYSKALDYYEQALKIAREIRDCQVEGAALNGLGNVYKKLRQYEQAIDFYQQHRKIAQKIGDHQSEGAALGNLGVVFYDLGQYEQAIDFCQQHRKIAQKIRDRWSEGIALGNMGATQLKLKQYPESLTNTQTALKIFQEIGFRFGEAEALKQLAELHQALGKVEMAQQYCQQALELATELGIPLAEECEKLQESITSSISILSG
ncbi:tetratricopeptide repeat protein [Alkalinema sp. FACHB-956]|uniref:tetratricopeptide repeat protein n=1 Tax=Alkalinema sp. FACHB-956 TaxID=2692768 RepID=UPI001681EEA4|nr:tetratricopeptide repeat protein [Alkalinema sp. FACHB-956]MBD2325837.1 ATP-binding protein [Alkalinema sp. FACHB-956]